MTEQKYTFACPHCEGLVEVLASQINCKIFRHGVMRGTHNQVNPHASRDECDRLVRDNAVWGCCRPFTFDGQTVAKCEYI